MKSDVYILTTEKPTKPNKKTFLNFILTFLQDNNYKTTVIDIKRDVLSLQKIQQGKSIIILDSQESLTTQDTWLQTTKSCLKDILKSNGTEEQPSPILGIGWGSLILAETLSPDTLRSRVQYKTQPIVNIVKTRPNLLLRGVENSFKASLTSPTLTYNKIIDVTSKFEQYITSYEVRHISCFGVNFDLTPNPKTNNRLNTETILRNFLSLNPIPTYTTQDEISFLMGKMHNK